MERMKDKISAPKIGLDELPVFLRVPSGTGRQYEVDETEAILMALAQAVEQRDRQTAGHCERLAFTSMSLGIAMGLERPNLLALYRGGYLHDIGKVSVPDSILFKPARLTGDEWVVMRNHTINGESICAHLTALQPVLPIIRSHHERWNGSGYPDGLAGEEIPLLARILQVADIYDALTSQRPYKAALAPEKALAVLEEETVKGWRDPEVVGLFLKLHKDVFSKVGDYLTPSDRNLELLRGALSGLHKRVA